MVSVMDFKLSGPGPGPDWAHCAIFLDKKLCPNPSYSDTVQSGVKMGTSEFNTPSHLNGNKDKLWQQLLGHWPDRHRLNITNKLLGKLKIKCWHGSGRSLGGAWGAQAPSLFLVRGIFFMTSPTKIFWGVHAKKGPNLSSRSGSATAW